MAPLTHARALPYRESRKLPATGPTAGRAEIARFREAQVVNPSGVTEPTVVALDLADTAPSVSALYELVVPLAQAARAGSLGPLALAVCTTDTAVHDVLRALAETYDLALFIAPAPDRLGEAEPVGALTAAERETLDVLRRLGGRASVSRFAEATGLAAPAATNRLVSVLQKGFIQKLDQPRNSGSVYIDPRVAIPANHQPAAALPEPQARELAIFAAVAGVSPDDLLVRTIVEQQEEQGPVDTGDVAAVIEAWSAYKRRHAGEVSERLRWAQAMLADAGQASVEMSGMSDEDLDELRREFEQ